MARLSNRDYLCCITPSSIVKCNPLPDQFALSTCNDILSHNILRIFIWLIGVLSTVCNILAIIWHIKNTTKKTRVASLLLINLFVADLIMGLYLISITIANINYAGNLAGNLEIWLRSSLCLCASFFISLSSLMSTITLFLITLDRYLHLAFPFSDYRLSYSSAIISTIMSWILCFSYVIIPIIFSINQPSQFRLYGTNSVCLPGNFANIYYFIWLISYCAGTFLVWVVIAVLYVIILVQLNVSRRETSRKVSSTDKIIQYKMITIVWTDLICWMPLYTVLLRYLFGYGLDPHSLPFIAILSLPLNSCINPILYTIYTQKFLKFASNSLRKFQSCCGLCKLKNSGNELEHDRRFLCMFSS